MILKQATGDSRTNIVTVEWSDGTQDRFRAHRLTIGMAKRLHRMTDREATVDDVLRAMGNGAVREEGLNERV